MKLTVDKLCRLLASQENILDEVALYPLVMRWFVPASMCHSIAERLPDPSLAFQWRQPLEARFSPGHFTVPVVVQRAAELPHASPAWLLPLAWKPGPHSKQIPTSLCELADRVAASLIDSKRLNEHLHTKDQRTRLVQSWGLHWSLDDWCEVDLSDASLSPDSAWAPLAIGLASAVLDQALEKNLFSTGCWNAVKKHWEVGPESLADKLRSAWGAGKRLFAVPRSHAKSVEGFLAIATENMGDHESKPLAIELTDSSTGDLYEGVLAAVMRAGLEPDRSVPQQHRIDYYLTRGTNSDADDFYRRNLLASIAEQRRAELAAMQLEGWRPEHLVSIVSNSDVLIPLAVITFLPKHVHLIYTKDTQAFQGMSQRYAKLEAWFRSSECPDCVASLSPFEIDDEPHALPTLANYLNQLSRHSGASSVLVDVTPGKRAMQIAMLEGTRAGDRVLCWWHDTHAAAEESKLFATAGLELTSLPRYRLKTEDDSSAVDFASIQLAVRVRGEHSGFSQLDRMSLWHPLGGERRMAHWQTSDLASIWSCPMSIRKALMTAVNVRMTLATPAIFGSGWKPSWLNDQLEGTPPNSDTRLKLVGVCNGRWKAISGWSLQKINQRGRLDPAGAPGPKPIRRMVPAGSVYFFQVVGGGNPSSLSDLWLDPISDADQERRDGFGLATWGTW